MIREKLKSLREKVWRASTRLLASRDFDMTRRVEVRESEGEEIEKTQPLVLEDDYENHLYVTDENFNPLPYYIDPDGIVWIYNEWVRDGSEQIRLFYNGCNHSIIHKIVRWLQPSTFLYFDDVVAVHHLV